MGEKMQLFSSSSKNDFRCNKFDRLNSNKKQCEMIFKMGPHIVLIPIGNILPRDEQVCFSLHKPLGCKEVEFILANNSWL